MKTLYTLLLFTLIISSSEAQVSMLADINAGTNGSSPSSYTSFNNKLYFSADDGINGYEMWVYDGINPPSMVADINPIGDSGANGFIVFNNKLFFLAQDTSNGYEMWVYDGVNPPSLFSNIDSASTDGFYYGAGFHVFNNKL